MWNSIMLDCFVSPTRQSIIAFNSFLEGLSKVAELATHAKGELSIPLKISSQPYPFLCFQNIIERLCTLQMFKEFGWHTFTSDCVCAAVVGCFPVVYTYSYFIPNCGWCLYLALRWT